MCISSTWQALNGLVKPGGRLLYNGATGRYELIARVGETSVYVVTDKGRAEWEREPEGIRISGVCDNCDVNTTVRPKRLGEECMYLCGRCMARLLLAAPPAQEGAYGI